MLKVDEPITLKNLTIPNRILRSATMENMADEKGFVTEELVRLYSALAQGGAGLIVTGASAVEPRGRVWKHQLSLWNDKFINALEKISEAIHKNGNGRCAIQLHHGGAAGFGYSYGAGNGGFEINSASSSEINETIENFGKAAARVLAAGFDAVAVHGAHGYLLSQFLSPAVNQRTDQWGGSLENRMRFAIEVCHAIRSEVGADMPLLWKINCSDYCDGGQDIVEYAQVAGALVKAGVDLIEVSGGIKEQIKLRGALKKQAGEQEAYFRRAIQPFRDAIGDKTLVITGGIRSRKVIEELLDGGVDMVGICRPLISEPDFANKISMLDNYKTARCISCNKCLLRIATQPLKCVEFNKTDVD